ncbi:calcium-binding protein [Paraburkholderia sp. DHOC27]|uniref:calcium-binding protein n=1 Tax=Paraburkholderia sp. DHOC27 TaxID=2303330 RepID=UPI0015F32E3E|nr:calcium-binding protein [Paraburkholderia sp. DHOC27]
MQTYSFSDYLGPLFDTGASMAGAMETAAGGDVAGTAVAIGLTIVGAQPALTGNGLVGAIGSIVGAGDSITTAVGGLQDEIDAVSSSLTNYQDALASGDQGSISAGGLAVVEAVANAVNTLGSVISGVAGAMASADMVGSAAMAPVASLGLAISAVAGLLAMTASNLVTDAVKSAANDISNLLNDISSQSGTGSSTSGSWGSGKTGESSSTSKGPESGAGGGAMGKYPDDGLDFTSPLVLDLTGSGLNLTPLNTSSPYFDLANDGFARQTGWIGAGMGLLCFDPNDQEITNITQLFGNEKTDGFDILSKLDTNHDMVIDASDPEFASLRVWVDANGNGTTNSGELYTLSQLGIVSINLNAAAVSETVAGNKISSISTYTMSDGTTREIADAWFANSTMNTKPLTPVAISETAANLPQIAGAGTLRDLRSAMTLDHSLQSLVQNFVTQTAGTSPAAIESAGQAILFQWAGITSVDPNSRGGAIDARQLSFVEQYLGRPFYSTGDGVNPGIRASAYLQQCWNDLYDATLARLILQSPLAASVAPEFYYDSSTDTVRASATFAPALAAAFERLGTISSTNLASWDLLLRVADAARFDMGMSDSVFEKYVAAATNDTIASVANAITSGLQISIDASGRMQETGSTIYHDYYAAPGVSVLIGQRAGNDPSVQLPGHDVFHYSAGDGVVEIRESDPNSSVPANTLSFGLRIDPSSIKAKVLSNGDIVLTDGVAGDQITVVGGLRDDGRGLQIVRFNDGTTWGRFQLIELAAVCGTTVNDTLYGTAAAEVFDGKGGNDYVQGGGGGDTFMFNAGYGKLEISESDSSKTPYNVLAFGPGISASSVSVRTNANGGIVLTDGIAGDQITLDSAMLFYNMGVQAVRFADNTVWTQQQLLRMATTGTAADDKIYGTSNAEVFDGKGGNDYVQGGGGGDTFIFNAGYGKLEIAETDSSKTPHNVLQLGTGLSASSIAVRVTENFNIVLTDGVAGDQITLDWEASSLASGVQEVQFADGTTWDRQQMLQMAATGTTGNDKLYAASIGVVFDGKGGNDYIQSQGGGDTFIFNAGYGKLEILEFDSSKSPLNVLKLGAGIDASSLTVRTSGNNLILTDGIAGDQITLDSFKTANSYGVQEVQFADGTNFNRDQLLDMANRPVMFAERQINNLIAGMASYGVEPAASSQTLVVAQPQPQVTLSANLY